MTMITITESALKHIGRMLQKENGKALRLSIKKTGCSGYAYAPRIVSAIAPGEIVVEHQGIQIVIDPLWQHILENLVVDLQEDSESGIKQKQLTFTNPNEGNRCGCGISFQLKQEE